jgi:multiple sugar transport system permease protein
MKGYYDSIPKSLDEAGKIDGCRPLQVLRQIVFPLSIPGNVATLVFSFLLSWNEYLFSLSLTTKDSMYTIPVGIAMFMGEYQTSWNELMAASVAASLPIIIVYFLVDKYMIGGLAAGAGR